MNMNKLAVVVGVMNLVAMVLFGYASSYFTNEVTQAHPLLTVSLTFGFMLIGAGSLFTIMARLCESKYSKASRLLLEAMPTSDRDRMIGEWAKNHLKEEAKRVLALQEQGEENFARQVKQGRILPTLKLVSDAYLISGMTMDSLFDLAKKK